MKPIYLIAILAATLFCITCKNTHSIKNHKVYNVNSPFYKFSLDTIDWKVTPSIFSDVKLHFRGALLPIQLSIFSQANEYQNTAVISDRIIENSRKSSPELDINMESDVLIGNEKYTLFTFNNATGPYGKKIVGKLYELVEQNSSVAFYFYHEAKFESHYEEFIENTVKNALIKVEH